LTRPSAHDRPCEDGRVKPGHDVLSIGCVLSIGRVLSIGCVLSIGRATVPKRQRLQ
jgi:hypothetical protein